jgi:hypothetical protein
MQDTQPVFKVTFLSNNMAPISYKTELDDEQCMLNKHTKQLLRGKTWKALSSYSMAALVHADQSHRLYFHLTANEERSFATLKHIVFQEQRYCKFHGISHILESDIYERMLYPEYSPLRKP